MVYKIAVSMAAIPMWQCDYHRSRHSLLLLSFFSFTLVFPDSEQPMISTNYLLFNLLIPRNIIGKKYCSLGCKYFRFFFILSKKQRTSTPLLIISSRYWSHIFFVITMRDLQKERFDAIFEIIFFGWVSDFLVIFFSWLEKRKQI